MQKVVSHEGQPQLINGSSISIGKFGNVYAVRPSILQQDTVICLCVSRGSNFSPLGSSLIVGTSVKVAMSQLPSEVSEAMASSTLQSSCVSLCLGECPVSRSVTLCSAELQNLSPSMRATLTPILLILMDGWCVISGCEVELPWGMGGKSTLRATITSSFHGFQRLRVGATVFTIGNVAASSDAKKISSPWKSDNAILYRSPSGKGGKQPRTPTGTPDSNKIGDGGSGGDGNAGVHENDSIKFTQSTVTPSTSSTSALLLRSDSDSLFPTLAPYLPPVPPCVLPGLEEPWRCLWECIVWTAASPGFFNSLANPPRGLLLTGPSGVGKSALVGALLEHCRAALKRTEGKPAIGKLGYERVAGGDIISPILGESEKRLMEAFRRAREEAKVGEDGVSNGIAVVFIDDLDVLCPKRDETNTGSVTSRLTTLLLTTMDGISSAGKETHQNVTLFVVGATSRADSLDGALRRPGRFEKEQSCPVPSLTTRSLILTHLLASIVSHVPPPGEQAIVLGERVLDSCVPAIAEASVGCVGADLSAVVALAIEEARKESMTITNFSASNSVPPPPVLVSPDHLWRALKCVGVSSLRSGIASSFSHGPLRRDASSKSRGGDFMEQREDAFRSVGGLRPIVERIRNRVVAPFKQPFLASSLGVAPPRGVLFHGPPGNSKTSLALALTEALGASFFPLSGSEILSCFVGEAERRVRNVFMQARSTTPAVIFFDELDALVGNRGLGGGAGDKGGVVSSGVLATLLTELDGVVGWEGVLVVGATNRLGALDPALLRPGRLEVHFYIPQPGLEAREEILMVHANPLPRRVGNGEDIDFRSIALQTNGFNGAQLKDLCTRAGMCALRTRVSEVESGRICIEDPLLVSNSHFQAALSSL